jgi:hypothetical protein
VLLIDLKREALIMRRDIEAASSYLWGPVVNRTESEVRLRNIERRLTLLVAHVGDEQRRNAFMAAQKLGHGRISTAHFNEKRVEEWKSDLARFRKFLERLPLIRHVNLADS